MVQVQIMNTALALQLPDTISRKGKPPEEIVVSYVRELGLEDIQSLVQTTIGVKNSSLLKVREIHHNLARLLASGLTQAAVGRITGYSQSRISVLMGDPSFKNLIDYYRTQTDEVYLDMHQQIATVGGMALSEITERLEDRPEEFSPKELRELAQMTLDRSGHGPTKTKITINSADVIKGIRDKVLAERKGKVIDVEATVVSPDEED